MAFVNIEDLTGGLEMLVFPQTLAEYGNMIFEGNAVEIYANVNAKEDEEPKLLCDRLKIAPKEPQMSSARNNPSEQGQPTQKRKSPQRLYVKLPSKTSKECEYTKKLLAVFEGTSPVSFYYSDVKEYEHLPYNNNVYLNDVMINELKRVLGDGCVVVK